MLIVTFDSYGFYSDTVTENDKPSDRSEQSEAKMYTNVRIFIEVAVLLRRKLKLACLCLQEKRYHLIEQIICK